MDPRLGIDTSGPGEAVFAIRFNGKPQIVRKNEISESENKSEKSEKKILLGPFFGDELEMSSVYVFLCLFL